MADPSHPPAVGAERCRSCPRSKPSPATCAGWWSVPGSRRFGSSWLKTLRSQDPRALRGRRRRAGDRRDVAAGEARRPRSRRRARRPGGAPDDGAVITIHLKMTGQLFVVRAGPRTIRTSGSSLDVRGRARAAVPRHPQVRAGRASRGVIRRPATSRASSAGRRRSRASGRSRSIRASPPARSRAGFAARRGRLKPLLLDQSFLAGVGNIYADEALWAARLHPLRSARRSGPATRRACTAS